MVSVEPRFRLRSLLAIPMVAALALGIPYRVHWWHRLFREVRARLMQNDESVRTARGGMVGGGGYRYRPGLFFGLTFALSWLPWFAAAWFSFRPGMEAYQYGFLLVGGLGPSAAALLLIRASGDDFLKSDFRARLIDMRRFNPPYLLVTFLLMPVVTWIAVRLSLSLGQSPDQLTVSPDIFVRVPITLLAPTIEELGWRGYGMDSLRARTSMLKASVLFGVLWALWHWPLFLINGTYQRELLASQLFTVNFFVSVLPIAIIANWLYYKHRRLIPAAILFHFMLDAVPQGFAIGQVAKCIETVMFAFVALLIVAIDRKAFGPDAGVSRARNEGYAR